MERAVILGATKYSKSMLGCSSLLRRSLMRNDSIGTRKLLLPCSTAVNQTVYDAREKLKKIVGSSMSFRESRDADVMGMKLAAKQEELEARRMEDSYQEAILPLSKDLFLRQKYINFFNHVRYGRIMEDLDTMAVYVGYGHIRGKGADLTQKSPIVIVTAFVDSMHVRSEYISPEHDLIIRGHVTWIGSTSLEVSLNVVQDKSGSLVDMLDAKFLMVARDPSNKGKAFVNPLVVETPQEKELWNFGEANKTNRQKDSADSLLKTPPNEEERNVIHNLFVSTINQRSGTFRQLVKPENSVWMEDAKLKNVIICFPENRNLYNKIFGGYLMRQAFELGWANACVYCKSTTGVSLTAVDDIMFQNPVEIGSLLYLSSQIVYTQSPLFVVKVHAEVVNPSTGAHTTTNTFYFTFKSPQAIPAVMPRSYAEYMIYLDGKRHLERSLAQM